MTDTGGVRKNPPYAILYVEDDVTTRFAFSLLLSRRYPDGRIDVAEDGVSGLELFRESYYDLVITDNRMPGMTGVQMVSAMRALREIPPVIFLSGDLEQCGFLDGCARGSVYYVPKPVRFFELFGLIDTCLQPG